MLPIIAAALPAAINAGASLFTSTSAEHAYANRYQTEVADLKKAGLNPALAYGQNPGTPPAQTLPDDLGNSAVQALQLQQARKQQAAQTDLTQAQANLLKAQTADLVTSTHAKALVDQQLPDKQRFDNIVAEMNSLISQRANARDLATYNSSVAGQNALNRLNVLRSQLAGLQLPQAQALSKWWKNHPNIGAWATSAGGISKLLETAGNAATTGAMLIP